MKKSLLAIALMGAMVASADDSYLYWMVGSDAGDYAYAKVREVNPDGYLNIYDDTGLIGDSVSKAVLSSYSDEGLYALIASGSSASSSFIVELYNDQGKFLSQSTIPYSQGSFYAGGFAQPPSSGATFTSFAIPEPNSGLLMLVGCALLGLRRRKQKVA